ncbi:short-chain dehydrogenase [Culex quinquefasciatus]|uniref:Short-chain dehydrogenase/reductase 3 n=1 Tax=Culex quinquefasciatus TaxID=7176 RepID=B0WE80_CULQU|nr:short-chain dehydrogenase [Culex quinquefasciatus]|eukprot:XP_001847014.1 short-chain dehydrogenase [Culex quinquefasciatus]
MDTDQVKYFKHQDGEYVPAARDLLGRQKSPKDWYGIVFKVMRVIVLFIPTLLGELFRLFLGTRRKSIRGQLALVTGGGNGLGRSLCLRLARKGCQVAVADIDLIAAQRTAQEVRDLGVRAEPFLVDVGDQKSVEQLKSDVEAKLGPVDILVNNAGLLAMLSLSEGTPEDVQRIINVNLASHFWAIRAFKNGMMERRRGHIVAVSSTFGIVAFGRTVCYSATKFGVRGLMEALNEEFYMNGYGNEIFVTCVYPGFVATRQEFLDYLHQLGCRVPIQTPDEVADLAIDGVLKNRCEVIASPLYMQLMLKLYSLMPNGINRLVMDIFVDNVPRLGYRKSLLNGES